LVLGFSFACTVELVTALLGVAHACQELQKFAAVDTAVFGGVHSSSLSASCCTWCQELILRIYPTLSAEEGDQEVARTGVNGDEQVPAFASNRMR
jgi:hypothetical protein